jgi:hypothetical protein
MSNKSMIDDILGQILSLTDEEDGDKSPADVEIASHMADDADRVDPEGQEPEHEMEMQPEEATIEIASPDGDGDEDLMDALDDMDWDDDSDSDEHEDKEEDPLTLAKGGEVKRRKPFGTMRRR